MGERQHTKQRQHTAQRLRWPRRAVVHLIAAASAIAMAAGAASAVDVDGLPGDCNGDGRVTVNELILGVNIALGNQPASNCPPFDRNGDGSVGISELIAAVSAALGATTPVPNPTPSHTAVPTTVAATPPASATATGTAALTPTGPTTAATSTATATPPTAATSTGTATPPTAAASTATATPTATATAASPSPGQSATATPTASRSATPTPSPPACAATPLASMSDVSIAGSTAGASDTAGGASCGFGGGLGAPDAVYEYVAPATGVYDIRTRDATFGVYLYVRAGSCASAATELGCVDSPDDAALALSLTAGQRIAVVVDGSSPSGGSFVLEISRRQPNLVIDSLTAPANATAGQQVDVAAVVRNAGNFPTGPFGVELMFARDASLGARLGAESVRCEIGNGLAPGASAPCQPLTRLSVPLVAAGDYVVAAVVDDGDVVAERDETDNVAVRASSIGVLGGELQQELYRARDGTVYQLLSVVPRPLATAATRYRVTTLGAAADGVESCAAQTAQPDAVTHAVAGSTLPALLAGARRTAIIRSNDSMAVEFDPARGGRLLLGAGDGAVEVCGRPDTCGPAGVPLAPLDQASDGIPAACVAAGVPGAVCGGTELASVIGFTTAQSGVCTPATSVTAETQICATAPLDGFTLRAGESLVAVYEPGRGTFAVGVGGFGLADGAGVCAPGRVVAARAFSARDDERPLLSRVAALADPPNNLIAAVALSPDDTRLYGVSDVGTLLQFARDPATGALTQLANAADPVPGHGAAVAVSPDGTVVYALTADGSITAFEADTTSGLLRAVQTRRNGVGGVTGLVAPSQATVSADGRYIYVVGAQAVVVFRREPASGSLTFLQSEPLAVGTGIAQSPDGAHVYVGTLQSAVAVFARDAESGLLTFLGLDPPETEPLPAPVRLAVTPDGAQVVLARGEQSIVVLARDAETGRLSLADAVSTELVEPPTFNSVDDVAVSGDGTRIYATAKIGSPDAGAIAVYARDPAAGTVELLGAVTDGIPADELPTRAVVTADGASLYVPTVPLLLVGGQAPRGSLLHFQRAEAPELLTLSGSVTPPISVPPAYALDPDGAFIYEARGADQALQILRRDAASGTVSRGATLHQGIGGVEGLMLPIDAAASRSGAFILDALANSVAAFARTGDDGLRFADIVRSEDPAAVFDAVAISPDDRTVYLGRCVVTELSAAGEIGVFALGDDGTLEHRQTVRNGEGGLNDFGCSGPLTFDPAGRHLYTAARFLGGVTQFARDADAGTLAYVDTFDLDVIGSVAISPDGTRAYIAGGATAIVILARDPQDGRLTEIARLEDPGDPRLFNSGDIAISPAGTLLFLESQFLPNQPTLGVYRRGPGDTVTLEQVFEHTRLVAISPDERFVYLQRASLELFAVAD